MNPNRELIDGLTALAKFLEEHPELSAPVGVTRVDFFCCKLTEVARAGYGHLEKVAYDLGLIVLRKKFGPHVQIDWNQSRSEVCERIVTTQMVERPIMQQVGTETVEEEIVTWKCPESLLAP